MLHARGQQSHRVWPRLCALRQEEHLALEDNEKHVVRRVYVRLFLVARLHPCQVHIEQLQAERRAAHQNLAVTCVAPADGVMRPGAISVAEV
eukprot:CAMPEP_0183344122 /NCGR_PEP_ID=MMETSP0164_2-20130417/9879_1 /TAXON_ID=221442 /ORGANISM="Coccolithus pelagicus ssp braarudi, Strain PLY182g" /LENGTH=91 /DNA_ID=CAMNT_0025515079 /DNA_START=409 /DNA_END=685 /DNA_ORIENTATION=-